MKRLGLSLSLTLLSSGLVSAAEEASHHVVQSGETLSTIAQKYIGSPVYPKRTGSLAKLLSLNPHISNPAHVRAGEKLNLGGLDLRVPATATTMVPNSPVPEKTPTFAPVPLLPAPDEGEFMPRSHLRWDIGVEYFRIDSKDKSSGDKAVFLSNLSPQTRLSWDLDWSEHWSSRVRVSLQSEKILGDEQATKTFNDASGSRAGFEAGAIRRWRDSSLGLFLGRSQGIFARGVNAGTLAFDRVESFEAKISHQRNLLRVKTVSLDFGLDARLISPGQGIGYTTESGTGGDASLILRHDLKNFSLEAQSYYGIFRQNSSLAEQTGSRTGLYLGVTWGFE
ncbi:MAG: LysM peptidoglycan-binding domain-containing protein [Bdellovibrionaceae bacterium]|nr:LysM peptidoglycan-binding domain-containing protein [Pseudobdellovibrionaceae bacterium]